MSPFKTTLPFSASRNMGLLSGILLTSLIGNTYAAYHNFGIPASKATVDVRVFNVANMTLLNETHAFILPVVPGHESAPFPMYSFLVEHRASQKRLMFDLGIRKDPENTPPAISVALASGFAQLEPYKEIAVLLQDGGINLTSIDAVIWSHAHFDHVGDMSTFPNTTGIIIGPETDTSIYPDNPNSSLQASDFVGHNITKVDFANSKLTFSGLKAVDYFGDGSFYLLNTPDAKSSVSTDYFWSHDSRPGAFDLRSRAQALLGISDLPDRFYADPVAAGVSLEKVATFDADADFLVVAAHDISLRDAIPYFPAYINGWKASRLKEKVVWEFLDRANPAFVFSPTSSNGTA
ncbi:hypothetical protein B0H14DRAFT_3143442 [Mycena olivaceomarginata]|nr:hypothetical protein B0H14DRAFT_3143442 [Mycena olivaceomarginata]